MTKILVGLLGIVLLFFSFFLSQTLQKGEKGALALDTQKHVNGVVVGPPLCTWEVSSPDRVMAENKTQAILISVKNNEKEACESYIALRAPSFDTNPPKEEQKITLQPNQKGSLSWILTPRRTGTFEFSVSDSIDTKIFGITVKNIFGLSSAQAKVFSFIGTLCGPMLTIPWWIERWHKKKQESQKPKPTESKEA